jgi:hypothetical protein
MPVLTFKIVPTANVIAAAAAPISIMRSPEV